MKHTVLHLYSFLSFQWNSCTLKEHGFQESVLEVHQQLACDQVVGEHVFRKSLGAHFSQLHNVSLHFNGVNIGPL